MFCAVTLRKLAIELTWFAQIPFLASFTPSPVWNKNNCTNLWQNKQKTMHHTTQKCGTNPVDEDIFRQTRVWILDLAESVHHFSTIQLLNQLLQSSIWCRKVVENLNGYCGRLCNCGYFFPFTDDRVGEQRHAILLCRFSSAAAVCWRWNSCTHLIISCRDHKNLIDTHPLYQPGGYHYCFPHTWTRP